MDRTEYAQQLRAARRALEDAVRSAEEEVQAAIRRAEEKKTEARGHYHLRLEELADMWLQVNEEDGGAKLVVVEAKASPPPAPTHQEHVPLPDDSSLATAAHSPETADHQAPEAGGKPAAAPNYTDDEVLAVSLDLLRDRETVTFIDSLQEWDRRYPDRPVNRSTFSGIMQRLGKSGKLLIAAPGGRRRPTKFGAPQQKFDFGA